MKSALQILEGALTRLRRDGWCQHESMTPDGRVCITGSMIAELDMLQIDDGGVIQQPLSVLSQKQLANLKQAGRICAEVLGSFDAPAWNNAPERTFTDIEALLTAAIAIAAEQRGAQEPQAPARPALSLVGVGVSE